MFGFFEDALDGLIELPGKIIEGGAELVTRLPEVPMRMAKGIQNGVSKGIDKVEEALDDLDL
jgi:hypothetical protein